MNPTATITDHQRPKTCNEAAALFYPDQAQVCPAFVEHETNSVSLSTLPTIHLLDLNDEFWALTLEHAVFVTSEEQFRQYNPSTGLYLPVQDSTLIGQILTNLNQCSQFFPAALDYGSFAMLKNRTRLKSVIERARDLLAVDDTFFNAQSPYHMICSNGIVNAVTRKFLPFTPDMHFKAKLPVKYDPEAKPDMFLGAFLKEIMSPEDIDVLQQFSSQLLSGVNHAQKILILTGDSGWGKSTIMKILASLLGWERIGIIRSQLYTNDLELAHYAGKHLLYCPDMNSQFLFRKESSIFKQLVGNDPIWAEAKDGQRTTIEGRFPIVLACNGKPQVMLDQDTEAWARRLVVLEFKKPGEGEHKGRLAEVLCQTELPAILNWLLDGFAKLHKNGLQLSMTKEQQTRAAVLLLSSDSPAAFVRSCIVKQKDGVVGSAEMYERYQEWSRKHNLQPFNSKQFSQTARQEIERGLGLRLRHDMRAENGGVMRGWKGLALVDDSDVEKASVVSGYIF